MPTTKPPTVVRGLGKPRSSFAPKGWGAMGSARINIGNHESAQEAAEELTTYSANALNQYTSIQEGEQEAFAPQFDATGNQTQVQTSTGVWGVTYNAENRPFPK